MTTAERNYAESQGFALIAAKDMKNLIDLLTTKEEFESWAFVFESVAAESGWTDMVVEAVARREPIHQSELGPAVAIVGTNLYAFLANRCRGNAQTIVKLVARGHGFEALRQIYSEFRPHGMEPNAVMLATIVQPFWWKKPPHDRRAFLEVLRDWDSLIAQYELSSKEARRLFGKFVKKSPAQRARSS